MRALPLSLLLLASVALAFPPMAIQLTATTTGVDGADLADTPTTNAINMEAGLKTNQLSLRLEVTPGTSLTVDVTCYESEDGTNFAQIAFCDESGVCSPDVRAYTLADWTADGDGDYQINTRWAVSKKWIKCSADDSADGDGTVTITGERSWQG